METNENIIDLGSINVPTSWNDITLKKFSEIERYYEDKDKDFDVREVLHILTDKSIDYINMLPAEFLEDILTKLTFLNKRPEEKQPTNEIIIDGVTYKVNTMEKLKTGEYVSVDTVMKADKHNYAAILAILCRKEGEIYDSKFEAEILNDRIEMYEKVPVTDVLPIIGFFLQCYVISATPTLLSSRIREAISHIRQATEISVKNGIHSKHFTKSVEKKLRKLEKSISSI